MCGYSCKYCLLGGFLVEGKGFFCCRFVWIVWVRMLVLIFFRCVFWVICMFFLCLSVFIRKAGIIIKIKWGLNKLGGNIGVIRVFFGTLGLGCVFSIKIVIVFR